MGNLKTDFDFSGYATKNDLKCGDGRVIRRDAFSKNNGMTVPLVWQHLHNEPSNVLGHVLLENREDGVYAYGKFNDTPSGQQAKALVSHKDIDAMSIYANELVQKGFDVLHGMIREVSLVLAGSNPGALIDNLTMAHGDGTEVPVEDEALIYTGETISLKDSKESKESKEKKPELSHADPPSGGDQTVQQVIDSMTETQREVMYALIADVMDSEGSVQQSGLNDNDEGEGKVMKHNVFDKEESKTNRVRLTQEQFNEVLGDALKTGSFRDSLLAHAGTYGIDNIDYLFPDAQAVTGTPEMYARDVAWVRGVLSGTRHTPFSRIKSTHADITPDAARAKGYVTGALKKEEVFALARRITTPTTIYKKQKLDRDDIIDITDLDVVSWMKSEMRVMLDEELGRAVLVSDGRAVEDEEKIPEDKIRPIWTDADMYAHHTILDFALQTDDIIDEIIRARKFYRGSGDVTFYTTTDLVTDMLLEKDSTGRRLYSTKAELASALSVNRIVEVPVMEGLTRTVTGTPDYDVDLLGIIVDLADYTIGADKGGAVSMFEDFDIDYNQQKYLLETRVSGALTRYKSALVFEQKKA